MSVFFGERTSADDRGCFSSPRSGSSAPRHADARARVGEERDALFGIHGGRKPCWRVGSWRNGGREERGAQAKEGKKKVKSRAELYATRTVRLVMQGSDLFVGSLVLELIHTIVVYFVQRTIMIVLIHLLLLLLFLLLHLYC